jgi:hypothetical protein
LTSSALGKGTRALDIGQWERDVTGVICPGTKEVPMKLNAKRMLLVAAVLALGSLGSVEWSKNSGLSLSIESAEAR